MQISCRSDLDFMERVQQEVTNKVQDQVYYESKLKTVWQRAVQTDAYRELKGFSMQAFHSLPVTRKSQLKAEPMKYLRVPVGTALKYYRTTGTTGNPTPTPRTSQDMIANTISVAEAWRSQLGNQGHRVAIMLPSDIVPVADLVVGVCEFLGVPHVKAYPYTIGISDWDRIIDLWEDFKPTVLFLAPGVLLQFTQVLKGRGLLSRMRTVVRSLMLLGEVSTPELRAMVGRWWNAQALDASYGSTESGTLAACCAHDRLHLLTKANYFEIESDGRVLSAEAGRNGRLIVTPLNNDARPLLRLEMGDEVSLDGSCTCGATTPTVTVHGREQDAVTIKGVRITTRDVESVLFSADDVMGYQIEMTESGSWARLLLERDPDGGREGEQSKVDHLQHAMQQRFLLRWDDVCYVNHLPTITKSGGSQKNWKRSNFRIVESAEPS